MNITDGVKCLNGSIFYNDIEFLLGQYVKLHFTLDGTDYIEVKPYIRGCLRSKLPYAQLDCPHDILGNKKVFPYGMNTLIAFRNFFEKMGKYKPLFLSLIRNSVVIFRGFDYSHNFRVHLQNKTTRLPKAAPNLLLNLYVDRFYIDVFGSIEEFKSRSCASHM